MQPTKTSEGRVCPSLAINPLPCSYDVLRLDSNATRGGVYVGSQLYFDTVVLETFLGRDLA